MRTAIRDEEPVDIHRFVDLKAKRKPLRYTIDGVVQRGRIYALTGPTNAGKTGLCTMVALAVATGRRDILNLGVAKGRVVYLAIENPDDTVSRFAIAQHFHGIHDFQLRDRLFIVTVKATPESVFAELEKLSQSGRFALVIVDTLAAYFDGTDMNDNVAAGNFMRRLRALSTVLGNPAVVVPAHPVKGAKRRIAQSLWRRRNRQRSRRESDTLACSKISANFTTRLNCAAPISIRFYSGSKNTGAMKSSTARDVASSCR